MQLLSMRIFRGKMGKGCLWEQGMVCQHHCSPYRILGEAMDADPTSDINCSQLNLTNRTCFSFSKRDFDAVFGTKVALASLAAIACCAAVLLIILSKAYKRFVHRLTLYLAIAALIYSIVFVLQILPVQASCGVVMVRSEQLCMAVAFLILYAAWGMLLYLCWITFHLFVLTVFQCNYNSRQYEVGGIIICHTCPVLFCIVPFINFGHGTMYGLAGAWCWITVTGESCQPYEEGLIEQFTLWYGPLMLVVLLNFLSVVIMVTVLYRGTRKTSGLLATTYQLQSQYRKALKEAMPLLLYPIIYNIICCLAFANRVYYAVTNETNIPLWMAHAVADPCLPLFIPVAFLLHPYTLQKCRTAVEKWHTKDCQPSNTYFVVSKEDVCMSGEGTKLIVGQNEAASSGYQSIF